MFRGGVPALVIDSLATGLELTRADDTLVDADAGPLNKIYTDGTFWDVTDTLNADWKNQYQVVFDSADVQATGASFYTDAFNLNIPSQVAIAIDDNITLPAWLSTWTDSGKDHVINNKTLSIYVKAHSAGLVTLGGNSGGATDQMFVCTVAPGYGRIPNEESTGTIEFNSASYQGDDDAGAITFYVDRVGGAAGAASCNCSIQSGGAHGTLNTTSFSWTNGDAAQKSGTFTPNDVSGDQQAVLLLDTFVGATEGGRSTTTVNITDVGAATAQEYFVDTATGNDSDDGLSFANAWATISKAMSTIQPDAGGDVLLHIEGGSYRDDPIVSVRNFTNTSNLVIRPRTSDVTLYGPTGSEIPYGIDITHDYIKVESNAGGDKFIVDGEGTYEVDKRPTGWNIRYGFRVSGDNSNIECDHTVCFGYIGGEVTGVNVECKIDGYFHGSPSDETGKSFGDGLVSRGAGPVYIRNSRWERQGHSPCALRQGKNLVHHSRFDNNYTGVAGFAATDGFRGGSVWGGNPNGDGTGAYETSYDDCIFRYGGGGTAGNGTTSIKFNGSSNRIMRSFFVGGRGEAIQSEDSVNQRIIHNTFYDVGGDALIIMNNKTNNGGFYPITDWRAFNNIAYNLNTSRLLWIKNWKQSVSGDWWDNIFIRDWIIDSGMNIRIDGDSNDSGFNAGDYPGTQTVAWYESNYPSNFFNLTVADPQFASANSDPDFVDAGGDIYNQFTCSSSSVLNQAANLTTVSADGTASVVDLVDPYVILEPHGFDGPDQGPEAGQNWRYHVEGEGNTDFDSVNYTNKTMQFSSVVSVNNGDAINIPFSGTAPNLGAVQ